jgi:RimJ/RimL family protein N-acetyltransferase
MDPEVMKMVAFGRPFTEDEAIQVHTWLMACATSVPGFGTWAGYAKGEFVGWWILAPISTKEYPEIFMTDRTEYGFRVSPKFWGQGYAKEGGREMVRYALRGTGSDGGDWRDDDYQQGFSGGYGRLWAEAR